MECYPSRLVRDAFGSWYVIPDHRSYRWQEFVDIQTTYMPVPDFAVEVYPTAIRFSEYDVVENENVSEL